MTTTMTKRPETQDDTPKPKRPAYVPAYRVSLVREPSVHMESRPLVSDAPAAVRAILVIRSGHDDGVDHFGILFLDNRRRIIGSFEVSVGCLSASLVHPREVFGAAIVHKAAAIAVFHNHPSGFRRTSALCGRRGLSSPVAHSGPS